MPGDVEVKDNANTVHQINTDVLGDSSETQIVKLQLGDAGYDAGVISKQNPLPIELVGLFKRLFNSLCKLTYDVSGQLRTVVTGSVTVGGSLTTLTTVTTANVGFGDSGKTSAVMQTSAIMFGDTVRRNFTKA